MYYFLFIWLPVRKIVSAVQTGRTANCVEASRNLQTHTTLSMAHPRRYVWIQLLAPRRTTSSRSQGHRPRHAMSVQQVNSMLKGATLPSAHCVILELFGRIQLPSYVSLVVQDALHVHLGRAVRPALIQISTFKLTGPAKIHVKRER